jgi:Putative glycosyl/glycerophosphate transferases involved in teichoic acid biosynthesis TagF/TagB/EpsJ/RodC
MRKNDRDGIIDLIATIEEALDYCSRVSFEEVGTLYEDCEIALSSILGALKEHLKEASLSSYHFEIGNLETSIHALHNAKLNSLEGDFYDNTLKSLSTLRNRLLAEELQYEVLFLPYNVTMWDSLESIWMAAKEDPNCIPIVMVIPYYDKNPDGSLGQVHYDGELFPDYVPITHYSEYNIEAHRPDVIFYHNPYDKFNRVTTVHPAFYSSELKKYTDLLVYIPYFIVKDHILEEFAIMPGVFRANIVIVQSEQIAQEYREYYPGADKEKFIPLGSPKYDKLISMNKLSREELRLPEEWKRKIKNKKVILYNTHLDHLINSGDSLIRKIQYVLSCFENREDVILLWRPHPLSEATIIALNPSLLKKYKEIEEEYRNNDSMIFDDTQELHRSIALADAYYGDRSSLVTMFEKVEKPVMLQDIRLYRMASKEEVLGLSFEDAYICEDGIWFASSLNNALCYKANQDEKVTYIGKFHGEDQNQVRLYSKVVYFKGRLIFIPFFAKSIAEYNIAQNQFKKIEIEDENVLGKFYTYVVNNEYLYLFPCAYQKCIRYNMDNCEIEYMDLWSKLINNHLTVENSFKFINVRQANGKIYAPFFQKNILFTFDLNSEAVEVIDIEGDSSDAYSGVEIIGEDIILISSRQYKLNRWNEKTKESNFFLYSDKECEAPLYIDSCVRNDEIILLDTANGTVTRVNKGNHFIQLGNFDFKDSQEEARGKNMFPYCNIKVLNDVELILFPMGKCEMILMDDSTVKRIVYTSPKSKQNETGADCELYVEDFNVSLTSYIDLVATDRDIVDHTNINKADYPECGKIIYEIIMDTFN